jgi:hypothetical protein
MLLRGSANSSAIGLSKPVWGTPELNVSEAAQYHLLHMCGTPTSASRPVGVFLHEHNYLIVSDIFDIIPLMLWTVVKLLIFCISVVVNNVDLDSVIATVYRSLVTQC